jgi:hypothetical protein
MKETFFISKYTDVYFDVVLKMNFNDADFSRDSKPFVRNEKAQF